MKVDNENLRYLCKMPKIAVHFNMLPFDFDKFMQEILIVMHLQANVRKTHEVTLVLKQISLDLFVLQCIPLKERVLRKSKKRSIENSDSLNITQVNIYLNIDQIEEKDINRKLQQKHQHQLKQNHVFQQNNRGINYEWISNIL